MYVWPIVLEVSMFIFYMVSYQLENFHPCQNFSTPTTQLLTLYNPTKSMHYAEIKVTMIWSHYMISLHLQLS
jgi:hypothetical protein